MRADQKSDSRDKKKEIHLITFDDPEYPSLLKEIKDPPKTLYYIGRKELLQTRCAAVIGSRTTTAYGRNTARAIARCLAENGITVVSGMASGIDSCAHEGALEVGGKTIAVLGTGPDLCYPSSNLKLKAAIEARGLVLSEFPPGTQAMPYHFPMRNRIISGLSELTVVVQARVRSGALITAELAAEQGREVLAVPGNIDSMYNLGSNQLIREGISPVTTIENVLEPFGLDGRRRDDAAAGLGGMERQVYQALSEQGEMSTDELCLLLDCSPGYLLPILSALELKGLITSAMGKFFLAKP